MCMCARQTVRNVTVTERKSVSRGWSPCQHCAARTWLIARDPSTPPKPIVPGLACICRMYAVSSVCTRRVRYAGWQCFAALTRPHDSILIACALAGPRQDQRIKSGTEWEVSKIVGRRLYENTIQFEVLWKGWRGTTWEPYEML